MDRKGTVMELDEILNAEPEFRYRMLSRMKSDCEYYLGYGGRSANHLWALDEAKQIEYMKAIWNSFPEGQKPEWLSMEQIEEYGNKMGLLPHVTSVPCLSRCMTLRTRYLFRYPILLMSFNNMSEG